MRPHICWLLAFLGLAGSAVQAAVVTGLTVDVHSEGGPGVQNVPPDQHDKIDATLGDTWMIVRNGARTSFYDFTRRRRTEIDEVNHTRVDFPLYDVVGFRVMEFTNRRNLGKAMAAAKIAQIPFDPVETEHVLSIQEKPDDPLRVATDGGDTVFLNGAKTLVRKSSGATPVPPAQSRMFSQLVRYTWGGHPQALAALAQSNSIPATLTLTLTGSVGATTTVTLKVASVQQTDATQMDITAIPLESVPSGRSPVAQLLALGAKLTEAEIKAARQHVQDQIDASFNDKRPFDAYLGIIEWTLMTGEAPPTMDAARIAALKADPIVPVLNSALAAHPKAELPQVIDQLEALRPHAKTQGHMLDVFVANDRAMMGDTKAALTALVTVLQAHPFIAGAYKDLGDNLYMSFDTRSAWRSWAIGRRIAPGFANFVPVTQFESNLATQHPEYF